jgi:hypothetical protein
LFVSLEGDETKEGYFCEAFPLIPDEILTNRHDHRVSFKGDNGILFKGKEDSTDGKKENGEIP